MGYIKRRFDILTEEFKRRGFLPRMPWPAVNLPPEVMLDYAPDSIDISIIKGRIRERLLMKSQWYRYKGAALPSTFIDTFYK
jgi:hypothetical protein